MNTITIANPTAPTGHAAEPRTSISATLDAGKPAIQSLHPSMKYFAIPNLASQDVMVADPTNFVSAIPFHSSKEERRAWQSNPTTQHLFYSCVEGLIDSLRVTTSNPAHRLWGIVADYDSNITDESAIVKNAAPGLLPTWISRTFSGGRRSEDQSIRDRKS